MGDSGMGLFEVVFRNEDGWGVRKGVRPGSVGSWGSDVAVLPKRGVVIVVRVVLSNVAGSVDEAVPELCGFFVREVVGIPQVVAHIAGAGGWGLSNWLTVQKMPTQG